MTKLILALACLIAAASAQDCVNGWIDTTDNDACVCFTGYMGATCEDLGCQSCENDGWCSFANGPAGECVCAVGFTGATCADPDTSITPCENGFRVNETCYCFNGYMGDDCATDGCNNENCAEGGWCSYENGPAGVCVCTNGFTGDNCETAPAGYVAPEPLTGYMSVNDAVSDDWCNLNCNHSPAFCPAAFCAPMAL